MSNISSLHPNPYCGARHLLGSEAPATPPASNTGRATGDYRSAAQISDAPLFHALNSAARRAPQLLELFKQQVGGDWTDKSLSEGERANIAANAERVLKYLDRAGLSDSEQNGRIDGFKTLVVTIANPQKQHLADQGSEAWTLIDFAQRGYVALSDPDIHNQHYHIPPRKNHHADNRRSPLLPVERWNK